MHLWVTTCTHFCGGGNAGLLIDRVGDTSKLFSKVVTNACPTSSVWEAQKSFVEESEMVLERLPPQLKMGWRGVSDPRAPCNVPSLPAPSLRPPGWGRRAIRPDGSFLSVISTTVLFPIPGPSYCPLSFSQKRPSTASLIPQQPGKLGACMR